MPAYPCEECGALVDTSGDGICKKCKNSRPFKCSKCEKKIGLKSVFRPDKLTFRKPIFCTDCGSEEEYVDCRQCGISLRRSTGKEIAVKGVLQVYHKDCYEKQVKIYKRVLPCAILAMMLIFGYFGYMVHNAWFMAAIGAAIGFPIGKSIAKPFALK